MLPRQKTSPKNMRPRLAFKHRSTATRGSFDRIWVAELCWTWAVYCLALSDLVAGQHGQLIRSQVEVGGTGVDETTSWELAYSDSVTAVLRCTISRNIANSPMKQ
jgi:hypothetical protein